METSIEEWLATDDYKIVQDVLDNIIKDEGSETKKVLVCKPCLPDVQKKGILVMKRTYKYIFRYKAYSKSKGKDIWRYIYKKDLSSPRAKQAFKEGIAKFTNPEYVKTNITHQYVEVRGKRVQRLVMEGTPKLQPRPKPEKKPEMMEEGSIKTVSNQELNDSVRKIEPILRARLKPQPRKIEDGKGLGIFFLGVEYGTDAVITNIKPSDEKLYNHIEEYKNVYINTNTLSDISIMKDIVDKSIVEEKPRKEESGKILRTNQELGNLIARQYNRDPYMQKQIADEIKSNQKEDLPKIRQYFSNFKMPFGKHKGKKIKDIDSGYMNWMKKNDVWIAPFINKIGIESVKPEITTQVRNLRRWNEFVEAYHDEGGVGNPNEWSDKEKKEQYSAWIQTEG